MSGDLCVIDFAFADLRLGWDVDAVVNLHGYVGDCRNAAEGADDSARGAKFLYSLS